MRVFCLLTGNSGALSMGKPAEFWKGKTLRSKDWEQGIENSDQGASR